MLDFIVLGIVPGTTFVITLWWALLFAFVCSVALLVYVELTKPRQNNVEQLKLDLHDIAVAGQ
jgi:hypothetical protein